MGNLAEHKKVEGESRSQRFLFIQDAALIVSIITGVSYVMAFSFRKGVRDYYGITDLTNNEINISSIFQSINEMQKGILLIALMYLIIYLLTVVYLPVIKTGLFLTNKLFNIIVFHKTLNKNQLVYYSRERKKNFELFTKEERENIVKAISKIGTNFAFIMAIITLLPILFFEKNYVELFHKTVEPLYYLLIVFPLVVYLILKVLKRQNDFKDIINVKSFTSYIWDKSNWGAKVAIVLIISSILSLCFYNYGHKFAGDKREYLIAKVDGKDIIVLENNKDQLVVASIDLESEKVKADFKVIKVDSNTSDSFGFRKIIIENGITVPKF